MENINTLKNLIHLQKAFGYGTVRAQRIYEKLKANNLLSENSDKLLSCLTDEEKQ